MVDWHDIAFGIPKLGSLTDDEMERTFVERDGRWSTTTKAAMARLGADKLDLDENWASCSQRWECPGCGRQKPDILRVSKGGVLLARIDIHHDHLTDHLKALLHAAHGPQWRAAIPPGTAHLEQLGAKLIARFERSYVCIDCNAADGLVKSRLRNIPRPFSFRPSEIRRFITVRANSEHQVDVDAARAIFEEAREDYELRVALADTLAGLILKGDMTIEAGNMPSPFAGNPLSMLHHVHSWFIREGGLQYTEVSRDVAAFEAGSLSRDGVATGTRRKAKAVVQPTAEEVANYDGGGFPELWRAAPADWKCPACDRDRGQILRRSNNARRRWSGKLVRHKEFAIVQPEQLHEASSDRSGPYVDRHELHLICMDCADILAHVKARHPDISASAAIFQFADMRIAASSSPNEPHVVDWDIAAARARISLGLAEKVEAYWRWYNLVVGCRSNYRYYLDRSQGDANRAWARLKADFALELSEMADPDEWLEHLLEEAARIEIIDPFRVEVPQ